MKKKSAAMPFGSEALLSQLFISSNTGSNILTDMKECTTSAVYCEKVCLRLQCNYKQLWLNFITINELSLVIYGYRISEGYEGPK